MFRGHRIAVVVPAYNEAPKIARTLRSIPGFVDHVIVVDDGSTDGTGRVAARSQRRGLEVVTHPRNRGVGAAIATGYGRAHAGGADVTAVVGGGSQKGPAGPPPPGAAGVGGPGDHGEGERLCLAGGGRGGPAPPPVGHGGPA